MKLSKAIVIILLINIACLTKAADPVVKPFFKMSNLEIDQVIRDMVEKNLTITQKMNRFSELFLETQYKLTCTGDGPHALLEDWPLVNFKETNCMAYCEHVLALAISDNWDHFFNNLQHIRYKDGIIGMKSRNHYTMADWLPENSWLLNDAAKEVAGNKVKTVTRTISHINFFAGKGIEDKKYVKPDREITISYVPLDILREVEEKTKTGDVLALIYKKLDNIFSAHMLMIAEKNGKKMIRESSNSKMSTFDTPYQEWVKNINEKRSEKYLGLAIMRVKEDLNTPGKIILPWNISSMKEKK